VTIASLLFPTTDAGVGVQAVIVVLLTLSGLWLVRRSKDGLLFVAGLFVMTAALFALRTLH
jgi:hypothetical protein